MSSKNIQENPFPNLGVYGYEVLCKQRILNIPIDSIDHSAAECFNGPAEVDSSGKIKFKLRGLVYNSCSECPTGKSVLESQK